MCPEVQLQFKQRRLSVAVHAVMKGDCLWLEPPESRLPKTAQLQLLSVTVLQRLRV